jgi:spore germination protein YaaH
LRQALAVTAAALGLAVVGAAGGVVPALAFAQQNASAWQGAPARQSTSPRQSASAKRPAPLQAFVLAGAPDSLADLEAHASAVGVVYPTYFECEPLSGEITGEDTGAITAYANAHQIAVMPRFNCQEGQTVHLILTDPRIRARMLGDLVKIAENRAYAGVNLDLENDGAADRNALSSFVATLAGELHAHGKKLAVDVDGVTHEDAQVATGLYDDRALAAVADYVFVIAWGTHWEGSVAGPIAPLSFVAGVAAYLASLPNASHFVLGAPLYGLDWPAGGGPAHPATALRDEAVLALARSVGAKPVRDRAVDEVTFAYTRAGVGHRVWYMDAHAVADRLRIAREHGLAIGVWRLGGEDQALWSSAPVLEGEASAHA